MTLLELLEAERRGYLKLANEAKLPRDEYIYLAQADAVSRTACIVQTHIVDNEFRANMEEGPDLSVVEVDNLIGETE